MLLVHKNINVFFLLILAAVALPSVSAVVYSETNISTSVSNTTLTVTGETINVDELLIYNNSIHLENTTTYTAYGTATTYRINLTGNNNTTIVYQLPKINSSTGVANQIATITNGLGSNTNTTISIAVSNQPNTPILQHSNYSENITGTYYPGSGLFVFTATLTPGNNILYLQSTPAGSFTAPAACSAASSSISTFANWLTLLAVVLAVGIVLYVLYGVYSGAFVIDTAVIIKAGVGLIIAGIFIVIGVIIVAGAASTCV